MQKVLSDIVLEEEIYRPLPVADMILRPIEKIKLQHRAEKYQYNEDPGGIAYIKSTVKPGDIVFDIGAHKAGYLYFFVEQLDGTGKVFAFEPQAVLHKYLRKLKKLFHWDNVRMEPMAVSNTSGTAVLCIPYNGGRTSSPCATIIESHMNFQFQSKEEVNTVSLDDYCRQHQLVPDFLKVDVEGNELSVFMGAKQLLASHKPKILFECEARFVGEDKLLETFAFLQGIGYNGYFIWGDTMHPISTFRADIHQSATGRFYCNNFIFE